MKKFVLTFMLLVLFLMGTGVMVEASNQVTSIIPQCMDGIWVVLKRKQIDFQI